MRIAVPVSNDRTAETLSGIPSILYALVGYLAFCKTLGLGYSLLAASLALAMIGIICLAPVLANLARLGYHQMTPIQAASLPLILKGICHPDDARRARDYGVDGIYCSNHGGRQANGGLPAIDCLPGVVEAADGVPVLLMCEPQAHSLFPLASWQLCAPLDSVSAYDSYSSVNSLINLLANAFLHEILDKGRPRIHEIASLYQQLDELEQR